MANPVLLTILRRLTQREQKLVIVPDLVFDAEFELDKKSPTLIETIHLTFSDPTFSKTALIYQIFQFFTILLSIILFLISSQPAYWNSQPSSLKDLEIYCISIFTFDYAVRFLTASSKALWLVQTMNLIDVVVIAPFYIELVLSSIHIRALSVLRILRLLQILRVLKAGKHSKEVPILTNTIRRSIRGIWMLVFFVILLSVLSASVIFYMELSSQTFDSSTQVWYRQDGTVSPFQSIADTMWLSVVTITTVGYGDTYPVSPAGKFFDCCTMIFGSLVIGFPLAILGNNFASAEQDFNLRLIEDKRKNMAKRLYLKKKVAIKSFTSTIRDDLKTLKTIFRETREQSETLRTQVSHIESLYQALFPIEYEQNFSDTLILGYDLEQL